MKKEDTKVIKQEVASDEFFVKSSSPSKLTFQRVSPSNSESGKLLPNDDKSNHEAPELIGNYRVIARRWIDGKPEYLVETND